MAQRSSRFWPLFSLFLSVLLADIIVKQLVARFISPSTGFLFPFGGIGVFKNFFGVDFALVHEINKGAAWGIFAQFQHYLMAVRILLIAILICYLFFFNKQPRTYLPFVLILAGAIGNVLDFFFYGHVIDMFEWVFWGYHYPVFNLADVSIFVGVVMLGWQILRDSRSLKPRNASR